MISDETQALLAQLRPETSLTEDKDRVESQLNIQRSRLGELDSMIESEVARIRNEAEETRQEFARNIAKLESALNEITSELAGENPPQEHNEVTQG